MPLSADEIRQSFFGEHGIAAENSGYLLRQFLPKDRDAYFDDIRNTQPACKWLFESEHGEEARRLLWDVNGKLYLSHLGKKGNEYLSHPTKPL